MIETARAEGIGTPIVVVSARGTEHDRVHALELGADDYLVKPFSMKELVAVCRPPPAAACAAGGATRWGDRDRRATDRPARGAGVRRRRERRTDSRPVPPPLPLALDPGASRRGTSCSRDVGAPRDPSDRTVDVFVQQLREQIDAGRRDTTSSDAYGVGYKLEAASQRRGLMRSPSSANSGTGLVGGLRQSGGHASGCPHAVQSRSDADRARRPS